MNRIGIVFLSVVAAIAPAMVCAGPDFEQGRQNGLLLAATVVPRQWVDIIVDQCAKHSSTTQNEGARAVESWIDHNKLDLDTIDALLAKYRKSVPLDPNPKKAQDLTDSIVQGISDMANVQIQSNVSKVLSTFPEKEMSAACTKLFGAISSGTYDIRNNQPSAYALVEAYRRASASEAPLVAGGLYWTENSDHTYAVFKIIAVSDIGVLARFYRDKFGSPPKDVNPNELRMVGEKPGPGEALGLPVMGFKAETIRAVFSPGLIKTVLLTPKDEELVRECNAHSSSYL